MGLTFGVDTVYIVILRVISITYHLHLPCPVELTRWRGCFGASPTNGMQMISLPSRELPQPMRETRYDTLCFSVTCQDTTKKAVPARGSWVRAAWNSPLFTV